MRILIVNAHSNSLDSQKNFQDLLACTKEIVHSYNGTLGIKDQYVIRTKDNLDDLLFQETSSFNSITSARQFDTIDLVIVSGDLHLLPWTPANIKVLTLLGMCLKVKKYCFAIGFAMQALVYLAASGREGPITVVNGGGKGGKLGDIGSLQLDLDKVRPTDYFLDSVTGDLYHLNHEMRQWQPDCNVGLHHTRTASEKNTLGKYVIKSPIYRPKKELQGNTGGFVVDESNEIKCFVKKMHLRHWMFNECPMEFVVPYRGKWEVHSFSFTNKENVFEVLAESDLGPLIIEFPRMIGIKFMICKRYGETHKLLSNFIGKYTEQVLTNGQTQNIGILTYIANSKIPHSKVRFKTQENQENGKNKKEIIPLSLKATTLFKNNFQTIKPILSMASPKNGDDNDNVGAFKFSGLASAMKGHHILTQNNISDNRVKFGENFGRDSKRNSSADRTSHINRKPALLHNYQTEESTRFVDYVEEYGNNTKRNLSLENKRKGHKGFIINTNPYNIPRLKTSSSSGNLETLSKDTVKKFLYPDLDEKTSNFDKTAWVPGNLSQSKGSGSVKMNVIRIPTDTIRKKGPVKKIDESSLMGATLRISEPYLNHSNVFKSVRRKDDDKIIGLKNFITSIHTNSAVRDISTSHMNSENSSRKDYFPTQTQYYK